MVQSVGYVPICSQPTTPRRSLSIACVVVALSSPQGSKMGRRSGGDLPTPQKCVHHEPANCKDGRGNRQNDYPRPIHTGVLWFFGRWPARPGLRILSLSERIDVVLRLPKEGSSTAYANSIAVVAIGTIVCIDDVLFPFDKGQTATSASRWCRDIHVLIDSPLPHGVDLEANRGAVLRGDRRCIGVEGVSNRDDPPREDCGRLLKFFGRSPRLRTRTRVDLLGVPKEPEDTNYEREAHYHY